MAGGAAFTGALPDVMPTQWRVEWTALFGCGWRSPSAGAMSWGRRAAKLTAIFPQARRATTLFLPCIPWSRVMALIIIIVSPFSRQSARAHTHMCFRSDSTAAWTAQDQRAACIPPTSMSCACRAEGLGGERGTVVQSCAGGESGATARGSVGPPAIEATKESVEDDYRARRL